MTDTNYADDLSLLVNLPTQAEFLLHCPEQTTGSIGFSADKNKTEFMF